MAVIDWRIFLLPYEQAVDEIKVKFKSIRTELRTKNEYSPIEFITGRVKQISSIIEKANKFDIPISRIDEEIEDIAGLRIMCQFVGDIHKVVDIIRNRKDMQIMYEKNYIKDRKASGYRSYHMIVKYGVETAYGHKEILSEFQIRTLAMNFWATVEHSLNYKYKHQIPSEIKTQLVNAADAAFRLDELMMEIRDEIVDSQKFFETKSSAVTDITEDINFLNNDNNVKEANRLNLKLNKALEDGSIDELLDLRSISKKLVTKRFK